MADELETTLAHHGVLGMHWGQHKQSISDKIAQNKADRAEEESVQSVKTHNLRQASYITSFAAVGSVTLAQMVKDPRYRKGLLALGAAGGLAGVTIGYASDKSARRDVLFGGS